MVRPDTQKMTVGLMLSVICVIDWVIQPSFVSMMKRMLTGDLMDGSCWNAVIVVTWDIPRKTVIK